MSHITLDKELGVNAKLTYCPRCGGDAEELMLIGNKKRILECPNCNAKSYGGKPAGGKCPSCKNQSYNWLYVGDIGEHDKLPATRACAKCRVEIKEHEDIVTAGGIYWKCGNCLAIGVLKANDFSQAVREEHGLVNGEPCGIELTQEECPVCGRSDE